MKIIGKSFYLQNDVVKIARELIGKKLLTSFNGKVSGGIICETEAYEGITDGASHAFGNRLTDRTQIMYLEGGVAYIYLCYGIHSLFNVVTNKKGIPHAVLVRGLLPTVGLDVIKHRINLNVGQNIKLDGPGKLSKALGIHYTQTGISLMPQTGMIDKIWIEDGNNDFLEKDIKVTKRIGVDYAGDDADLPYRFILNNKQF